MAPNITERSKQLFIAYVEDAGNWSGHPLVGGNVPDTKEDRGNLTHLKKLGLINTDLDEGCIWLNFTAKGIQYARELNIGHLEDFYGVLCSECYHKSAVPEGKCCLAHTCYDPDTEVICEDWKWRKP